MARSTSITLPNLWTPRDYQLEAFRAADSGIKRHIWVWHRRSGKDSAAGNYIAKESHRRIGNYWALYPTAKQGRKAMWEAVDRDGRRVIDQMFPPPLRDTTRNDEMFIRFKNGSSVQVTGSDQADSLVGSNPVGVVFSEYALTSPSTWRFVEPILIENGGWAIFNSTPRGKNHLYDMVERNKDRPDKWFVSVKGWRDTGVITQADIDEAIASGMPPEIAAQEFDCSFNAVNVGVVYSREMVALRAQGRIRSVPYDPRYPVETAWDVGHRDATSILFFQRMPNGTIHIIDHHTDRSKGFPYYAGIVHSRGYAYSRHVGPHDLDNTLWIADASAQVIARNLGVHFTIAPKLRVDEGIMSARLFLGRCHIDADRCSQFIASLDQYQYEWDEDTRTLTTKPVHDWSSHDADALRYAATTPEGIGLVPAWAQDVVDLSWMSNATGPKVPRMAGRNHMTWAAPDGTEAIDPLGDWR